MDDGNALRGNSSIQSPGHDIGPDEDRHSNISNNVEMMPVDVITSHQFRDNGDVNDPYRRFYVARREDGVFQEPLDQTPAPTDDNPQSWHSTDERFREEKNRLKTFHLWSDDYHVNAEDLAREGFIYRGPGDKVMCVFCGKTLRGWEQGDVVETEHKRIYPDCPWVKGERFQINVPISREMALKKSFGLTMKETPTVSAESEERGMGTFQARYATFPQDWANYCPVRADALAEAGFFSIGTDDSVKCFTCGKSIGRWESGDDPWQEHSRWSPKCSFLEKRTRSASGPNEKANVGSTWFTSGATASSITSQPPTSSSSGKPQDPSRAVSNRQPVRGLSYPQQVSTAQIELDLQSPAVQAVLQVEEISVEEIIRRIQAIRLSNGDDYQIQLQDLLDG